MNFDPDKIYHELITAGEDWADKNSAAQFLEESKKTVLAQLTVDHLVGSTKAAAEVKALASNDYCSHINEMVIARKVSNKAMVVYYAQKALADMRRTQAANLRAEQKYISG